MLVGEEVAEGDVRVLVLELQRGGVFGGLLVGLGLLPRGLFGFIELLVLALLLGVNIGPNLTYVGSLASMLWLKVVRRDGLDPRLTDFTRHGVLTVPFALAGATVALWTGVQLIGT